MIDWIKDKYHWHIKNKRLRNFLSATQDHNILLFGYPKSGNTWLRFLLYNYRSLLLDPGVNKTMLFSELNNLQNNILDRGTTFKSKKGYPIFYRTHRSYYTAYDLFNFRIFIHRNPLDTLVSAYYFYRNRDIPFHDDELKVRDSLHDIDFYVKYKINDWIDFYNISIRKSNIIVNYSRLQRECSIELRRIISLLGWIVDDDLVARSINISSFDNIKSMSSESIQEYGNGPSDGTFHGQFLRSGTDGQYVDELNQDTINYVRDKFPRFDDIYII